MPNNKFNTVDIIILFSRWDILKIDTRVGGITYYFTGNPNFNKYNVSIFVASKAINTNCIYRDFSQANTSLTNNLEGIVSKIEGNVITVKDNNQEEQQIALKGHVNIVNYRTQKNMELENIKVNDKISIDKIVYKDNIQQTEDGSTVQVIRNLQGEDLKQELLEMPELEAQIIKIDNNQTQGTITLTCQIRDWYYDNNYETVPTFEVQILVEKDTTVLASTENQLQNLEEFLERKDTVYITLKKNQNGRLVAENIEVLGC